MSQKRNYDWEAIYRDYRTGRFQSDRELCRHWDVPPSTFRKRKKGSTESNGKVWEKDLEGRFKKELKNQSIQHLAHISEPEVPTGHEIINDQFTVENAAEAAMGIIKSHLKRIDVLNTISDELTSVLLGSIQSGDTSELVKWNLGKSETAIDSLSKLVRVASEIIKVERQAFNLDSKELSPESQGISIDSIQIIGVDPEDMV